MSDLEAIGFSLRSTFRFADMIRWGRLLRDQADDLLAEQASRLDRYDELDEQATRLCSYATAIEQLAMCVAGEAMACP